jgi:hypothetical protein
LRELSAVKLAAELTASDGYQRRERATLAAKTGR